MFMLEAMQIKKSFGAQTVLDFPVFRVYSGDKIGIIGDNGAGKTTLLKLLAGQIQPDSGTVVRNGKIVLLEQFSDGFTTLSGGEVQKQKIVEITQSHNSLIFADEPTANLDSSGIEWLTEVLKGLSTLVIISHNRTLLDQVCTSIVEVRDGKLNHYNLSYSDYLKEKEKERGGQEEAYDKAQSQRRNLKQAVEQKEKNLSRLKRNHKRDKIKNNSETRLAGDKRNALFKKVEKERKVLETRIERIPFVEKPKDDAALKLDFLLTDPPANKRVVVGENINLAYGDKVIFRDATLTLLGGERLAIGGENGSGKSSLIGLLPTFRLAPKLKIGYIMQDFSQIRLEKTVLENALTNNIQPMENVYNILARLMFTGAALEKPARALSGGERTRLLLAMVILSDTNALVLDEPTNFLDIASLEVLETTLSAYPGTILLVSHDQKFVDKVATRKLIIIDHKLIVPPRETKKSDNDRMLLELRRDSLVVALGSVGAKEKPSLEEEYEMILRELHLLK